MTGPQPDFGNMMGELPSTEAQKDQTPDPMPSIPYTAYSRDQWEQYLQEKLHEQHSGANPNAVLGIRKAVHALNSYQNQDIAPSTGQILGAEAKGVASIPGNVVRGLGQTMEDLGQGHLGRAAGDVVSGIGQTVKGTLQLPATALMAAGGMDVPSSDDILQRAQNYGASAPIAAATVSGINAAKGPITQAAGSAAGSLIGGTLGRLIRAVRAVGSIGEKDAAAAESGTAAGNPMGGTPKASLNDAGLTPEQAAQSPLRQLDDNIARLRDELGQPMPGQPQGIDYGEGQSSSLRTVSAADDALYKARHGESGFVNPQFEEGLPAARTSTVPRAPQAEIDAYLAKIADALKYGYSQQVRP